MQGGVDTGIPVFVDDVSKSCTQIILPMFVFANTGGNFLRGKEFDVCGKLSEIFLPGIYPNFCGTMLRNLCMCYYR